jgi:methyl-accepting chemotaxis protein
LAAEQGLQRCKRLSRIAGSADLMVRIAQNRVPCDALAREFKRLKQLKDYHTPIRKNIESAQKFVEEFQDNLDEMLDELSELVAAAEEETD